MENSLDGPYAAYDQQQLLVLLRELHEGKNRQVRRMTGAIGHGTLRLLRVRIGELDLGPLKAGAWRELTAEERRRVLSLPPS
jgi:pseudouridine synthase